MAKHNGRARKAGDKVGRAIANRHKSKGNGAGASGLGFFEDRHTTDIGPGQKNTQSVLERSDLDELMAMADLADRDFSAQRGEAIVISSGAFDALASERNDKERIEAELRNAHLLRIPRRPEWDESTSAEQLDQQERSSFLNWRRRLAVLEDTERLMLTPFEKNLEVWRQLWRVVERSDIVVQVLDARDPLLYRSPDLEAYARELHATKSSLLLLNKADLLTPTIRKMWADFFDKVGIEYVFWSAFQAGEEQLRLRSESNALGIDFLVYKKALRDGVRPAVAAAAAIANEANAKNIAVAAAARVDLEEEEEEEEEEDESPKNRGNPFAQIALEGADDEDDEEDDDEETEGEEEKEGKEKEEKTENKMKGDKKEEEEESEEEEEEKDPKESSEDETAQKTFAPPRNSSEDPRIRILDADELLDLLEEKARAAVAAAGKDDPRALDADRRCMVGLVGYPNVGKSSTINALFGAKKTAVAPTPGKTKHFQTLNVAPRLCICDCPGLVLPKYAKSKAEMVAAGVIPIDRLTDIRLPIEEVCRRVGRLQLQDVYGIHLPLPRSALPGAPPSAAQLLRTYAMLRGWTAGSGLPDETRVGRHVLKDYTNGKLLYCRLPPSDETPESLAAAKGWAPQCAPQKVLATAVAAVSTSPANQ